MYNRQSLGTETPSELLTILWFLRFLWKHPCALWWFSPLWLLWTLTHCHSFPLWYEPSFEIFEIPFPLRKGYVPSKFLWKSLWKLMLKPLNISEIFDPFFNPILWSLIADTSDVNFVIIFESLPLKFLDILNPLIQFAKLLWNVLPLSLK